MYEPNIPDWVTDRLGLVLPVLNKFFPENEISLGGGTLLQARWNHRISTDIDLFVSQKLFNSVIGSESSQLESNLYTIAEVDADRSWVVNDTVYCEVQGTELTVMPSNAFIDERSGYSVPGTTVNTESTATILHKKIAGRMVAAGVCEIRDVFDLYTAKSADITSLAKALQPIAQRSLSHVHAILLSQPINWYNKSDKPLIGVDPEPDLREIVTQVAELFRVGLRGDRG